LSAAGLISLIYYPLFFPSDHAALAIQSEEFFFEPNEAAGAPVLVLSFWLFYRRSHYLDVLRGPGKPLPGLLVLVPTLALYSWGHFTNAPDLQLASVIGLLFGAALCLGGWAAVRAFWVPILFLGFALPLPPVPLSAVIFPIQLLTAEFAGAILNLIGVKSLVQGDQILRPENTFIVIETCSGIRTIVTLTMLTVLMIDLFERRGWHAVLLLLLAPAVAFVTNGFRVVTLVLNPHSSIHSIHNLQGIAMLLVGLAIIYLLDLGLERGLGSAEVPAASSHHDDGARPASRLSSPMLGGAALLITLIAMGAVHRDGPLYQPPSGIDEMPGELLVRVFGEAETREIAPDFQFRGSLRYLAHSNRALRFEGKSAEVFLGVANEPIRSHTMLSKRLAWPESGWVPVEESYAPVGEGVDAARRVVLRRGGRKVLSYSWSPRAGSFAQEWFRQALALDRSPLSRPEHMLAIRISTSVERGDDDMQEAEGRIRRIWKRIAPELEGYAPLQPKNRASPR
jgi:exosortase